MSKARQSDSLSLFACSACCSLHVAVYCLCTVHCQAERWLRAQYLGSKRKELRDLVKPTGKRLWMSEFGCGSAPPNDMASALELSAMILRVRMHACTRALPCSPEFLDCLQAVSQIRLTKQGCLQLWCASTRR
jgi:hypothetical protein